MGLLGTPLGFFLMADAFASIKLKDINESRHRLKHLVRLLRAGIGMLLFCSPY